MAAAGHRFSSGGRHHARPVRAVLVANQSGAVRRVLPMQLAATAHRGQPVPANVPSAGGLHNTVHPGMLKFGIHLNAAFVSITGLLGVLATLGAIALAFDIKRIPWHTPLRILIASYWFSFGVGVVQWLSIHLRIKTLTDYFAHLMYRQYINESSVWGGGRPQFLFAEPSYIGMHLFGVLLPLMWLMRGRDRIYAKRLRNLIVVYAIGAVLMQAGTRIVLRANLPES